MPAFPVEVIDNLHKPKGIGIGNNFHFVYDNGDGCEEGANAKFWYRIHIWDGMRIDINQSIIKMMNLKQRGANICLMWVLLKKLARYTQRK